MSKVVTSAPDHEAVMRLLHEIADSVKEQTPKGWGFTVFLFPYGDATGPGKDTFYISTANREDMIQVLREFVGKQVS